MSCPLVSWTTGDGVVVALDGSEGVDVQRGAAGLDGRPIANTIDQRIGDGAVRVQHRRPAAPFTLPLLLNLDLISAGKVVAAFQGPGVLTAESGRALRDVVYEGGLEGVWSADGGVPGVWPHRKFPVSLLALDPMWQAAGKQVALAWGMPTAFDAAIPFDASIPFDGGSSTSVLNVGEVAVPVHVEFTGPLSSATVVAGGRRVSLATTLAAGQVLVYRGDPGGQFYPSTQGEVGPFLAGNRIDHSLTTADSEPLLLPPAGSTSVVVQNVTGDDGGTQIRVLFNERFLTP